MTYQSGCRGRVDLGDLPGHVRARLGRLPGEWLEYDPGLSAITVKHVEPTDAPVLLTAASELVCMISEIPYELQTRIPGGDFFVHLEETGQLVRLRVDRGGTIHVEWAHPGYEGAKKRPYDGREIAIEPWEHRLNGTVELVSADEAAAAEALQTLADSFEGLYPEGDFRPVVQEEGGLRVEMTDVNLDARLLVDRLIAFAKPRSLTGFVDVSSFGDVAPEHLVRLVFEDGEAWVQHPLLWSGPAG